MQGAFPLRARASRCQLADLTTEKHRVRDELPPPTMVHKSGPAVFTKPPEGPFGSALLFVGASKRP